mmetsp:Transcript_15090/g.32792  ORF Transcript_15090/g.32792 Transcript_15090/m.32792 type:complete len:250 (+) Transcript_15090:564-1313(+)
MGDDGDLWVESDLASTPGLRVQIRWPAIEVQGQDAQRELCVSRALCQGPNVLRLRLHGRATRSRPQCDGVRDGCGRVCKLLAQEHEAAVGGRVHGPRSDACRLGAWGGVRAHGRRGDDRGLRPVRQVRIRPQHAALPHQHRAGARNDWAEWSGRQDPLGAGPALQRQPRHPALRPGHRVLPRHGVEAVLARAQLFGVPRRPRQPVWAWQYITRREKTASISTEIFCVSEQFKPPTRGTNDALLNAQLRG